MITLVATLALLSSHQSPKPLYRFIAYGDTRGHRADDRDMAVQNAIVAGALESKPAFIVQSGDLVFDGSNRAQMDLFDVVMQPVWKARVPYYPARGNHDNLGESLYPGYLKNKIRKSWGKGVRKSDSPMRYSLDKNPLRFVFIDTEEPTTPGSVQYKWIERELSDAKKRKLVAVPVFHIAIYTIGSHGPHLKKRGDLEPLFRKYHVPLVFQGHDHNYYRTRRHDVVYVVTGGGGAPLYDQDPSKDPREENDPVDPHWPDVWQKAYHYCICDVYKDRIEVTAQAVNFGGPNPIDMFTVPLVSK